MTERYEVVLDKKHLNVAIKDNNAHRKIPFTKYSPQKYPFSKCCKDEEDYIQLEAEINNVCKLLNDQNLELKQALLFYLDVATGECSSNYRGDMEQWCRILFDCSHDEAKEKYGDFKLAERWELGD